MRDHGRIATAFYRSGDIRGLPDSWKLLAAYCLTGPHSNMAGVFCAPDGYVGDDLEWASERVQEGFGELDRKGWATRCQQTNWVVIHKYLKWNPIENPNQAKGLIKVVKTMPRGAAIGTSVFDAISEYCPKLSDAQLAEIRAHLDPKRDVNTQPLALRFERVSKSGVGAGAGIGAEVKAGEGGQAPPPPPVFPELDLNSSTHRESETPARTAQAYSDAYKTRYGVEPTFNAKTRGQIANFVQRVPWDDAPFIARFYVQHGRKLYCDSQHCIDLMLRDAEGLRTEYQRQIKKGTLVTGNWWETPRGIEYMGREKGIAACESFARFTAEVFHAMGDGPWMLKVDYLVQQHLDDVRKEAA